MCTERRPYRSQTGLTLVELIIFIIIVGIGVAGIVMVYSVTIKSSADPQVRKQMLAIAEALLEEVEFKPFTFCDPDDPNAATATGASGCTGGAGGVNDESRLPLGPDGSETRATFDNVGDYNGLVLPTASDINGNTIAGYAASISVTQQSVEGTIPLADSLRITVTVTHGSDSLSLSGYRTRYAPNTTP
jgi:MSHA pilin protein MshD